MAMAIPRIFPTVAPAPAPTFPSATTSAEAPVAAAYPQSGPGRTPPDRPRSKMIAAGTMGTTRSAPTR